MEGAIPPRPERAGSPCAFKMKDLDLANILRKERRTPDLEILENDFYDRVGEYLAELEEDLADIGDHYSVEAQIVGDELKAARGGIGRLIDLRMKKITRKVQRASSSSKELSLKGMTPQEEQIYRQMLSALIQGKEVILAQVNRADRPSTERALMAKKGMSQEYILVSMIDSVPTFVGVDGKRYTLFKGDLVTLPLVHARNLCDKNLAREIDLV